MCEEANTPIYLSHKSRDLAVGGEQLLHCTAGATQVLLQLSLQWLTSCSRRGQVWAALLQDHSRTTLTGTRRTKTCHKTSTFLSLLLLQQLCNWWLWPCSATLQWEGGLLQWCCARCRPLTDSTLGQPHNRSCPPHCCTDCTDCTLRYSGCPGLNTQSHSFGCSPVVDAAFVLLSPIPSLTTASVWS